MGNASPTAGIDVLHNRGIPEEISLFPTEIVYLIASYVSSIENWKIPLYRNKEMATLYSASLTDFPISDFKVMQNVVYRGSNVSLRLSFPPTDTWQGPLYEIQANEYVYFPHPLPNATKVNRLYDKSLYCQHAKSHWVISKTAPGNTLTFPMGYHGNHIEIRTIESTWLEVQSDHKDEVIDIALGRFFQNGKINGAIMFRSAAGTEDGKQKTCLILPSTHRFNLVMSHTKIDAVRFPCESLLFEWRSDSCSRLF